MTPQLPQSEVALSPLLEKELEAIGAEGVDRLLNVIRGLFQCVRDLNQRVAELERELAARHSGKN